MAKTTTRSLFWKIVVNREGHFLFDPVLVKDLDVRLDTFKLFVAEVARV
jgi:hypothetical protein